MLLLHPLVLPYLLEIATCIALNLHNQQKTKKEAVAKKIATASKINHSLLGTTYVVVPLFCASYKFFNFFIFY